MYMYTAVFPSLHSPPTLYSGVLPYLFCRRWQKARWCCFRVLGTTRLGVTPRTRSGGSCPNCARCGRLLEGKSEGVGDGHSHLYFHWCPPSSLVGEEPASYLWRGVPGLWLRDTGWWCSRGAAVCKRWEQYHHIIFLRKEHGIIW